MSVLPVFGTSVAVIQLARRCRALEERIQEKLAPIGCMIRFTVAPAGSPT